MLHLFWSASKKCYMDSDGNSYKKVTTTKKKKVFEDGRTGGYSENYLRKKENLFRGRYEKALKSEVGRKKGNEFYD